MDKEKSLGAFRDQLMTRGMFLTFERKVVFDEIFHLGRHFSAEDVFDKLKTGPGRVSRSTIYKTLALLEDMGFINRTGHGDRNGQYEYIYGKQEHGHLVCSRCGSITEFTDKAFRVIENRVSIKHGFNCEKLTLKIIGVCRRCKG